jgi:hypothetical protein
MGITNQASSDRKALYAAPTHCMAMLSQQLNGYLSYNKLANVINIFD